MRMRLPLQYRDEVTYVPEKGKKPENLSPRLMIAVGVPAYKIKLNETEDGNKTFTGLLGVASTDVPVDDIDKLTLPYKVRRVLTFVCGQ